MKTLWTTLSVLAIINLVAVGSVGSWLALTDRIDRERVQQVRTMFAQSVTTDRMADEKATADASSLAATESREHMLATSGGPAESVIAARDVVTEVDRQRLAGVASEIAAMRRTLAADRASLDRELAKFDSEREAFTKERERIKTLESDQQFRKTVGVLENLKPDAAKKILLQIIEGGETGRIDAVTYLNAVDDQVRTRVLAEFVKQDAKLAAELLEGLRQRGQGVALAEPPANDRTSQQ